MRFRTMMVIKAVVCLVFGVTILLAPVWLYGIFGATLDGGGVFAAREYGAAMLGILVLTWCGRNAPESDLRRVVAAALCVYDALGLVVTLVALFTGAIGALGWLVAALYLFLALGFGYFWLTSKRTT